MRRWAVIPDCQIKPGDDLEHLKWAGEAIVDYMPDVVIQIGDFWDMNSLSMHSAPGGLEAEGRRVKDDIDAGNEAWEILFAPMHKEKARRKRRRIKRWEPECHFITGNHDFRISRAVTQDAKWQGLLTMDALLTPGFQRHDFLKILELDGIKVCHYFPNPFSGKPIGGTILNRLNHVGSSFIQGHVQGFAYASKQYPDHVKHGLVCGRYYMHHESYRPADVQNSEWNGIVMLNEVKNGSYDLMPLSASYLQRKYG